MFGFVVCVGFFLFFLLYIIIFVSIIYSMDSTFSWDLFIFIQIIHSISSGTCGRVGWVGRRFMVQVVGVYHMI